jgi:hypothetical protein
MDSLRIPDCLMGGAIVGRMADIGLCSSSVFLRLDSPEGWTVLDFMAAGR